TGLRGARWSGARSGGNASRVDKSAHRSRLAELPGGALTSRRVLALPAAIDHTVCWVALSTGRLLVPENVEAGELAIFEPSHDAIDVYAEADAEFVLGSAVPHPYDLVLGRYSVHTSAATLRAGEQRISEIQHRL